MKCARITLRWTSITVVSTSLGTMTDPTEHSYESRWHPVSQSAPTTRGYSLGVPRRGCRALCSVTLSLGRARVRGARPTVRRCPTQDRTHVRSGAPQPSVGRFPDWATNHFECGGQFLHHSNLDTTIYIWSGCLLLVTKIRGQLITLFGHLNWAHMLRFHIWRVWENLRLSRKNILTKGGFSTVKSRKSMFFALHFPIKSAFLHFFN